MLNYTVKDYKIGGYYHLRLQSEDGRDLFLDSEDMEVFGQLLRGCPCLADVSLINGCLAWDHCHLLLHLHWMNGVSDLVAHVKDGYAAYFYEKYGYDRPLWDKRMQAVELQAPQEVYHVLNHIRNHSGVPPEAFWEQESNLELPMLKSYFACLGASSGRLVADKGGRSTAYLDYLCIDVPPQSQPPAESVKSVI